MNVLERINLLKKMVKEAERIVAWQTEIFTALHNIHANWVVSGRFPMARMPDMGVDKIMVGQGAGNSPVEEDKPVALLKAGTITDTTDAGGEIAVAFAEAFASVPVVIVQLEGDVDYYSVVTAKDAAGFTVKILKTAHLHSQGNTGAEAAHTHGISFASGAGSSHRHSNPSTSYVSAGTPSGTVGAGSAHSHTNPATGGPSATIGYWLLSNPIDRYAAEVSGGETTQVFWAARSHVSPYFPTSTHTHTQGNTGNESAHTHSFTGSALGTHRHTQGSTGYESAHTHTVSGNTGAGSNHSHTNPDTSEVNAGNALVTTAVTFSYIAMIP